MLDSAHCEVKFVIWPTYWKRSAAAGEKYVLMLYTLLACQTALYARFRPATGGGGGGLGEGGGGGLAGGEGGDGGDGGRAGGEGGDRGE